VAWVIGYASDEEVAELRARGWEVEDAERYNLVGAIHHHLLEAPYGEGNKAIAIWVDTSVMDIFNGPDWDKSKDTKRELKHDQEGHDQEEADGG